MNTYTSLALGIDNLVINVDDSSNVVEDLFTIGSDGDVVRRMHITGSIVQGRRTKQLSYDVLFIDEKRKEDKSDRDKEEDFSSAVSPAIAFVRDSLNWSARKLKDMSWFDRLGYTAFINVEADLDHAVRAKTYGALNIIKTGKGLIEPITKEK